MAARSVDTPGRHVHRVRDLSRPSARTTRRLGLSNRLVVVAPTTAEVVRAAGGWLVDRVLSGWDATVLVADHSDELAVRILGARADDLERALDVLPRWTPAGAVAVDAALYDADARVRAMVATAIGLGATDVRFWGEPCLVDDTCAHGAVQHRLSTAAKAFKAQALAATSAHGGAAGTLEAFDVPGLDGLEQDSLAAAAAVRPW